MSKKQQMADAIHRDPEQAALDCAATMDDLAALHGAEERRDAAAEALRLAQVAVRQARRRLTEAGWDVSVLRQRILERWKRRKGEANGANGTAH